MAKPSGTWCFVDHPHDGEYDGYQYPYYKDVDNEYHQVNTQTITISNGKIDGVTVESLLMNPTYSYQWNNQNYLQNTGELQWLPIGTEVYDYAASNSHLTYQNYRIKTEQGQLQIDGIGYKPQHGVNANENQYNISDYPLTFLNYVGSDREWLGIYNNLNDIENYDTDSFFILKLKPQLCFIKNGKPFDPGDQEAYGWKPDLQTLTNLEFDFNENATVQFLYHIHNQDFAITQEIKHDQWESQLNLTTGSVTLNVTVYEKQKSSITLPKLSSCSLTSDLGVYDNPTIKDYQENDDEYAFGIGQQIASHTIKYYNGYDAEEQKQLPMSGWQLLPFGRTDIGPDTMKKTLMYMLDISAVQQFDYYKDSIWKSLPHFYHTWMLPTGRPFKAQWLYNYCYQLTPYFLLPKVSYASRNTNLHEPGSHFSGSGLSPAYPPEYLSCDDLYEAPYVDDTHDSRHWASSIRPNLQWLIYKRPTNIPTLTDLYTEFFENFYTSLTPAPITWLNNTLCTWSVVGYDGPSWFSDDYKYIFYTFYTQQPQEQQYRYYVWKIKLINE